MKRSKTDIGSAKTGPWEFSEREKKEIDVIQGQFQPEKKEDNKTMTMADVTPEIAAKIVKQYILPMFKKPKNASLKGDVHKKLDLTEKLSVQLDQVESEVSYLKESVESIA
jgi:hypothetical protein